MFSSPPLRAGNTCICSGSGEPELGQSGFGFGNSDGRTSKAAGSLQKQFGPEEVASKRGCPGGVRKVTNRPEIFEFRVFVMGRMKAHSSPKDGPLPSTSARVSFDGAFEATEFHLRHSNVFPLDEREDAETGLRPPKMSLLKQSVAPLPPRTPGRSIRGRHAELNAALNAYFEKAGWTPRLRRTKKSSAEDSVVPANVVTGVFGSPDFDEAA